MLQGLTEIIKVVVFAASFIKKQSYCPIQVTVQEIDIYTKIQYIGYFVSLEGNIYDYSYDIFFMKEPDYTMKLMSKYYGLAMNNGKKEQKIMYK